QGDVSAWWLTARWYRTLINPAVVLLISICGLQTFRVLFAVISFVARAAVILGSARIGDAELAVASFSILGAVLNIVLIGYVMHHTYSRGKRRRGEIVVARGTRG